MHLPYKQTSSGPNPEFPTIEVATMRPFVETMMPIHQAHLFIIIILEMIVMPKALNLTNQRFGKLVAIKRG